MVSALCAGAEYKVRFSLTVPRSRAGDRVAPQLVIDGVLTCAGRAQLDVPSSTLSAGQVVTYTYTLTAPDDADDDIQVVASATATNTADILMRSAVISLGDCAGETDPSTITATPSTPPQVSGWTPVFEGETFSVTLAAQDDDGIESIEYRLGGGEPVSATFDGVQSGAVVVAPILNFVRTTLRYRVRDGNMMWSGWQTLTVNPRLIVNRMINENAGVEFRVGDPDSGGFGYSVAGLPAGVSFSPSTGQFGGVISFDANNPYSTDPAVASGVYTVVVTETAPGGATSHVGFTWTINNINAALHPRPGTRRSEGDAFSLQIVATTDGDARDWNITACRPACPDATGDEAGALAAPVSITRCTCPSPTAATVGHDLRTVTNSPRAGGQQRQLLTAEDMPPSGWFRACCRMTPTLR